MARLLGSWAFWAFLALLALVRVVEVEGEGRRYLLLPPWEEGRVEFVNSVTGRPVLLEFGLAWDFRGFRAFTDPETEAYYTGGEYPWNQALAQERRRELSFCSEVGLAVRLGGTWFRAEGACLRLRLLWPP
ncbi:MAG: hypothetical protein ABDH20_02575 [Thermus sp.]